MVCKLWGHTDPLTLGAAVLIEDDGTPHYELIVHSLVGGTTAGPYNWVKGGGRAKLAARTVLLIAAGIHVSTIGKLVGIPRCISINEKALPGTYTDSLWTPLPLFAGAIGVPLTPLDAGIGQACLPHASMPWLLGIVAEGVARGVLSYFDVMMLLDPDQPLWTIPNHAQAALLPREKTMAHWNRLQPWQANGDGKGYYRRAVVYGLPTWPYLSSPDSLIARRKRRYSRARK